MPRRALKAAIKRGALIAAANWQVTLIQASADSLFKLLLAALPLRLLTWLVRGLVFQYLGLVAVGAYLKLYRAFRADDRFSGAPVLGYFGSGAPVAGSRS